MASDSTLGRVFNWDAPFGRHPLPVAQALADRALADPAGFAHQRLATDFLDSTLKGFHTDAL